MINGFFMLVFAAVIFGAVIYIPRAFALDRADYHLMHGPLSGCMECEGK